MRESFIEDPILRTGAVAALALFTVILLLPLSPCKYAQAPEGAHAGRWALCGQEGWESLTIGGPETSALWFGKVDLSGVERWAFFSGLFGLLYLGYVRAYHAFTARLRK